MRRTAWNVERRLQGPTDTPLSAAGEADARTWRLPSPADGWQRLCSPLQRARRTAELLQPSAPVIVDSALREMSFGTWEGHTIAELRAEASASASSPPRRRGLDFQPPGGESPRAAMARIGRWTASIAAAGAAGRRGVAQGRDPRPAGAGHRLGHDGPAAAQARLALPAFLLGRRRWQRHASIASTCRSHEPRLLPRAAPAGHRPSAPRRRAGARPGGRRLRRAAGVGRRAASRAWRWAARASISCRRCARADESLRELRPPRRHAARRGVPAPAHARCCSACCAPRRPTSLITEQFPFGRTRLRFELLPLLRGGAGASAQAAADRVARCATWCAARPRRSGSPRRSSAPGALSMPC